LRIPLQIEITFIYAMTKLICSNNALFPFAPIIGQLPRKICTFRTTIESRHYIFISGFLLILSQYLYFALYFSILHRFHFILDLYSFQNTRSHRPMFVNYRTQFQIYRFFNFRFADSYFVFYKIILFS